ncbi:MAG TPA: hypothetical protein PKD85_11030, partial [Saprospiraceae bacterium]|nr:hypothetical protein [Saprospiraceae bacterium]
RDGWGAKGSGGRDGWGAKGKGGREGGREGWAENEIISRSLSPGGDYISGVNDLRWQPIKGTKDYVFVIEDAKNNIVHTTNVKGNMFTLDNSKVQLNMNEDYAWYVHHPTKREVSNPVSFRIIDQANIKSSLEEFNKLSFANHADEVVRELYTAFQYHENKHWLRINTS